MAELSERALAAAARCILAVGLLSKESPRFPRVQREFAAIIQNHMTVLSIDDAVAELDQLFINERKQFTPYANLDLFNKTIDIIRRSGREVSDG